MSERREAVTHWMSTKRIPLSRADIAKVDTDLLARMYAAESNGAVVPRADIFTERAWQLGYLNPRVGS